MKSSVKFSSALLWAMCMTLAMQFLCGCDEKDDVAAEAYAGAYDVTQTITSADGTTSENTYRITVAVRDEKGREIEISNFMGYGASSVVHATVKGNSFTIPLQTIYNLSVAAEIKGKGTKKGNTLTYTFDLDVEDGRHGSIRCVAVRDE